MLLAMASATGTQVLTPYLALFLVLYCVEIVLRVAAGADDWRDIWELKRLSRKRDVAGQPLYAAMGLRTDAGVTLVSIALYIGSRIQMVRAKKATNGKLTCLCMFTQHCVCVCVCVC